MLKDITNLYKNIKKSIYYHCFFPPWKHADTGYYTENKSEMKYILMTVTGICTITLDLDKFYNY